MPIAARVLPSAGAPTAASWPHSVALALLAVGGLAGARRSTRPTLRAALTRARRAGWAPCAGAYVRDLDSGADALRPPRRRRAGARRPTRSSTRPPTALLRFGPDATLRDRALVAGAEPDPTACCAATSTSSAAAIPTLRRRGAARRSPASCADAGHHPRSRGARRSATSRSSTRARLLRHRLRLRPRPRRRARRARRRPRPLARASPACYAARRCATRSSAGDVARRRAPRAARDASAGHDRARRRTSSPPMRRAHRRAPTHPSDNFSAEMLLKDLGARFGGTGGTTAAGAAVVRASSSARSASARRSSTARGCRAPTASRPRQVVRLLDAHGRRPGGRRRSAASLPVAGRTGTLRDRMRGTAAARPLPREDRHAHRRQRAVRATARRPAGARVAFSFLENRRRAPSAPSASRTGWSRLLAALRRLEQLRAARPRRAPRRPRRSAFSSFEPGESPATT